MTAGGGGMIVTDDDDLAAPRPHLTTQAKVPDVGYLHDEVGYNYRLTNLSAAFGLAQLDGSPNSSAQSFESRSVMTRRSPTCRLRRHPVSLGRSRRSGCTRCCWATSGSATPPRASWLIAGSAPAPCGVPCTFNRR